MNNKRGDGMTGGYFSPLGLVIDSLGATGGNSAVHEHLIPAGSIWATETEGVDGNAALINLSELWTGSMFALIIHPYNHIQKQIQIQCMSLECMLINDAS